MKTRKAVSENKSTAAGKLGGQPENDQDARDAGLASATSGTKAKKPEVPAKSDSQKIRKPVHH